MLLRVLDGANCQFKQQVVLVEDGGIITGSGINGIIDCFVHVV